MAELHENLRKARLLCGLTQEEAAEAVGTTVTSIWRYEAGYRRPSGPILFALATLYETTVAGFNGDDLPNVGNTSRGTRREALKVFGSHIRSRRNRAGLNQEEVARALGVSTQSIRNWESGRYEPGQKHKEVLAGLYRTSIENLGEDGGVGSEGDEIGDPTPSTYEEDMEFLRALPQLNFRGVRETLTPEDARVIRGVVLRLQELKRQQEENPDK